MQIFQNRTFTRQIIYNRELDKRAEHHRSKLDFPLPAFRPAQSIQSLVLNESSMVSIELYFIFSDNHLTA